jgi:uncharacterized protein (DUF1501 family)
MTFAPHQATRRELLLGSGALFAWAYMPRLALAEGRDPRFLVIVLRGALDGLATVAPVGDPDWIALRGEDALRLDGDNAALPLDNLFALNPAMPNLHRMYKAGQATIVHAVATPYRERSHFDGQDVLESGLTRAGASDTGWLNRALAGLQPGERISGKDAFAVGPITPLVARGPAKVLSYSPPRLQPASEDTLSRLLDLYRHTDPALARALEERGALAAIARGDMASGAPKLTGPYAGVRMYFNEAASAAAKFMAMDRASARSPSMAGTRTPMRAPRMDGCRRCWARSTARWRQSKAAWAMPGKTRRLPSSPSSGARRGSTAPRAPITAPRRSPCSPVARCAAAVWWRTGPASSRARCMMAAISGRPRIYAR